MTTDERVRDGLVSLADEVTPSADLFGRIETKRLHHERSRRNRRVLVGAAAAVVVLVAASVWMLRGDGSEHGARVATQPGETLPSPSVSSVPSSATTVPSSSAQTSNTPTNVEIADLTWISSTHGWALAVPQNCNGGPCAEVITTVDGGDTWTDLNAPNACVGLGTVCPTGTPSINSIRFASPDVGYLFGPDLLLTTDGGATWMVQPGRSVDALEVAGANAIRISSSTNGGCPGPCDWTIDRAPVGTNNWTKLPTPAIPYGVAAQLVRQGPDDVYAAFFGNPAGGAGTAYAQLVVSHDGGNSWSSRTDPCDVAGQFEYDLLNLAAAPGNVVAALCQARLSAPGSPPYVALSLDGGGTFSPARVIPAEIEPGLIAVLGPSDIVVASDRIGGGGPFFYKLAVSHDGGLSWTTAATTTDHSVGPVFTRGFLGFENAKTGRWVSSPNAIWTTTDGGDHWVEHTFG